MTLVYQLGGFIVKSITYIGEKTRNLYDSVVWFFLVTSNILGKCFNCVPNYTIPVVNYFKRVFSEIEKSNVDAVPTLRSTTESFLIDCTLFAYDFLTAILQLFIAIFKNWTWLFLWGLLNFYWYAIGSYFIELEADPGYVSDNVNVFVSGLVSFFNFFIGLACYFLLAFNVLNIPYTILAGSMLRLILVNSTGIAAIFALSGKASTTINSIGQDVSGLYFSVFRENDKWAEAEEVFNFALSYAWYYLYYYLDIFSLVFTLVLALIDFIPAWIATMTVPGLQATVSQTGCCVASGPALGCCIATVVGLGTLCDTSSLAGLPCACTAVDGGPFHISGGCGPVTYSCDYDDATGYYTETKYTRNSIESGVVGAVDNQGTNRDLVCRHYLYNNQAFDASDGGATSYTSSRLLKESILNDDVFPSKQACYFSCQTDKDGSTWKFRTCGKEKFLLGECNRELEGELWLQHIKNYEKKYPNEKPLPKKKFPNDFTPVDEKENFFAIVHKLEEEQKHPCAGSAAVDDGTYYNSLWRTYCLVTELLKKKTIANSKVKVDNKQSLYSTVVTTVPRHLTSILLHDGNTHELADKIVDIHHEVTGERKFAKNHHADRRKLLEERYYNATTSIKKRMIERRALLQVTTPAPTPPQNFKTTCGLDGWLCADGVTCVPYAERLSSSCVMPSTWSTGSISRYVSSVFVALGEGTDPRYYFEWLEGCYKLLLDQPESDPSTIANTFNRIAAGEDTKLGLLFCFPLVPRSTYPDYLDFSWNAFVQRYCQSAYTVDGEQKECVCPQYTKGAGLKSYNEKWLSWNVFYFVYARVVNTGLALQFLLTRWSFISYFVNTIWKTVCIFFFSQWVAPAVYNVFDPDYALHGLTENQNYACAGYSLMGSGVFVFLFLILPFWFYYFAIGKEAARIVLLPLNLLYILLNRILNYFGLRRLLAAGADGIARRLGFEKAIKARQSLKKLEKHVKRHVQLQRLRKKEFEEEEKANRRKAKQLEDSARQTANKLETGAASFGTVLKRLVAPSIVPDKKREMPQVVVDTKNQ